MSRNHRLGEMALIGVALLAWLACGGGGGGTGPQVAVKLAFVVQPGPGAGGAPLSAQPTVAALDAEDHVVPDATGSVTLALGAHPSGATLTGTLTGPFVNGVAIFHDVSIAHADQNYTLVASAQGLTAATSATFAIVAGPVMRLVFTTQPAGATGGLAFVTQPILEFQDSVGNRVATTASATMSLTGGNGGVLSGTLTRPALGGVVSFLDLKVDSASAGYVLVGSAAGVTPATSTPLTVLVGPPSAATSTIATPDSLVLAGDSIVVTLTSRDAGGNRRTTGGGSVGIINAPLEAGLGQTVDNGDGTYTWRSTSGTVGINAISALIAGVQLATPPAILRTEAFSEVSAGGSHTCARSYTSLIYCWGLGTSGQLGNGMKQSSPSPVRVAGNQEWAEVSAGGDHTCALDTSGQVWCWGHNGHGALGIGQPDLGATTDLAIPILVLGGLTARQVTAGLESVSCLTTTTFRGYCWGSNDYGQVGDSSFSDRNAPVLIANGLDLFVESMQAGQHTTCAGLLGDTLSHLIRCWGSDSAGALGDGAGAAPATCHGQPCSPYPRVSFGAFFFYSFPASERLAVGTTHACGTSDNGDILCWGDNASGQFGNGSNTPSDTLSLGVTNAIRPVTAGDRFTCGVFNQGVVSCWGDNTFGQLGTGNNSPSSIPIPITGSLSNLPNLDAGLHHACYTVGAVYCWGDNSFGQVGDGSIVRRITPTRIVLRR